MKELLDPERIAYYLREFGLEDVLPASLRQHLSLYSFATDETLCNQGEEPQYIHFLVKGKVKVFNTSTEGRTLLINFTTPLGVLGEIECIRQMTYLNTVMAVGEVETIAFHKRWLLHYEREASLLHFLLQMVTEKFYIKSVALSFNLLHPVEVRLASYLLSVSSNEKQEDVAGIHMTSLRDIANLIGTSYRHLNRVLQRFCADGLVERSRGIVVVIDRQGLNEVAGHNIYENGDRKL